MRLPRARDPRLHLAATITTVQVLGQAFLGWELSIAQILVCLVTCAVLEIPLVLWESKVVAWPASALLTGNGVALVLRVNGTEHGDWWSLHGWYVFAATSALALGSKHLVRFEGRPVVNPSNLGLVVCFLVLGTDRVNPLDFWWGPLSPSMVAVYATLLAGAMVVTRRLGLLWMSLSFWAVFAGSLGVLAATGHCLSARWSVDPVCGVAFWRTVTTSPEVLIFMLFMITDPMTSPQRPRSRVLFGAWVGLASALLVAPMRTEFGAKVGVLGGLVLVCALRPVLTTAVRRGWLRPPAGVTAGWRRVALGAGVAAVAAGLLVAAGLPASGPARAGAAAQVDPAVLGGRPPVHLPAGAVPPVTVRSEVESVIGSEAQDQAHLMARHLVEDLTIVADAVREGDPDLAATASAGVRLRSLRAAIGAGSATALAHHFSTMTVVMVRDPLDPQAIPRFGIRATGTRGPQGQGGEPFDVVFVLVDVDGTWLVTDELAPEDT